jgi:hypothetical protein
MFAPARWRALRFTIFRGLIPRCLVMVALDASNKPVA